MVRELALSTVMVLATVAMHGIGLYYLRALVDWAGRLNPHKLWRFSRKGLTVAVIVLGFYVLHGLEIWFYAIVYRSIGAVENLRDAVYFSTITYGAIGYSDIHIAERWKIVAAIEGINGVLLLGWSVAFFVANMMRVRRW